MKQQLSRSFANMLATDLDGTLVGDDKACEHLLSWMRSELKEFCLVYITGRHLASVQDLIREKSLPQPDLLATDVGTRIYIGSDLKPDYNWQQVMTRNWQPNRIKQAAEGIYGLKLQKLPNDFRVSFYSEGSGPAEQLRAKLQKTGVKFTYIFSSNRDVDILPAAGGKGEALKYLVTEYLSDNAAILTAGDSGNDREMLTAGFPGVIVGNAQPELKQLPESQLIYRAKQAYAAGIQEGWQHFYGKIK